MRQTLRERRDASQMEDLLDDSIENELIDNKINHLLSEIHNRFVFFCFQNEIFGLNLGFFYFWSYDHGLTIYV